jgi:mannosyltransferase OCH1-like enzyme
MIQILSSVKNDVENIIIKCFSNIDTNFFYYDANHPIIDIEQIKYIDEHNIFLKINILKYDEKYDGNVDIFIIDKYDESKYYKKTFENFYDTSEIYLFLPFEIKQDTTSNKYKIPKIIHQSYKTNYVYPNNYNAISSWKRMNLNYEYKYWDDNAVINLIKNNFDNKILQAYEMLYAGACKSDIFRLCVLYLEGGIWSDISAICYLSMDLLINLDYDLITSKDTPSQIKYPNIYQAFIATTPKNPIIKFILDFTVDRVIRNEYYDNILYPYLKGEAIAITGPTIFALATNLYLGRQINDFFEEGVFDINNLKIKILNHVPGQILDGNIKIIQTKYENFSNDRYNIHYSILLNKGYIFKKHIQDINIENSDLYLYQCWIQSEYVSKNMENAINTWKQFHPKWNYKLITDEKFKKLLENDNEFPNLLSVYNSIKPFAYKSDIIRLYMLYKTGGIYADIDSICYKSCDDLCKENELILCIDINPLHISNGFMCAKKGNLFIKLLLETIIEKITKKDINGGDLSITGPKLIGDTFQKYFSVNPPFVPKTYSLKGKRVKLIPYVFNLPFPKGTWNLSCKKSKIINGNILETYARKINGSYMYNKIKFNLSDNLTNTDGVITNNTSLNYTECDGSGLIYDNETFNVILSTKYKEYNDERLLLDGNDFCDMYKKGDILC